jgi:hypothetical protein
VGIFDWLFGGKSEPTSEVPVWPVPDGSKQDDYLRACLEPAFQEEGLRGSEWVKTPQETV